MRCRLLLLALASFLSVAGADDRLSVPNEATQDKLLKLARDIYQEDYKAADTAEQKSALAKQIIKHANDKRDDPAARFVLLKLGSDIAAMSGDVSTAFGSAEALCRLYKVDDLKTKVSLFGKLTKSVRSGDQQGKLAEELASLIDQIAMADEFDMAQTVSSAMVRHAKRSKDKALIKKALGKEAHVQRIISAYRGIEEHLATLETQPTDPAANSAVGRFYCFVKGDWATGVPMLALGSKGDELKALARAEIIEGELSTDDRVAAGDALWKLAGTKDYEKYVDVLKDRARYHYQLALPNVDGLVKDKIAKRIAVAALDAEAGNPAGDVKKNRVLPKGVILYLNFSEEQMYRKGGKAYVKDLSGGGRDALVNRALLDPNVKSGALRFGGSHQFVYAPGPWRFGKALTIAAWVRFEHFSNDYPHIVFGEGNNIAFHGCGPAYRRRNLLDRVGFYSANQHKLNQVCTAHPLNVNQWYYIVVADSIRASAIYLDGQLSGQKAKARPALIPPMRFLMIGSGQKTDGQFTLNGSIGEVMIINRLLSSDEILKLYQTGRTKYVGGAVRNDGIK